MEKGKINVGLIITLIAVIAIGGYFIISSGNMESPVSEEDPVEDVDSNEDQQNETDEEETSDSPSSEVVEVIYSNDGFNPETVTISAGDRVEFVNTSDSAMWPASAVHPTHEVYDGTSLDNHCDGESDPFDACGEVSPRENWSFTFDKVGEWNYHDHLNSSNTGTIIVE